MINKVVYNRSKLAWFFAPIYAISWFLVFYIVFVNNFNSLPNIIEIPDEVDHQGSFIGERAEQMLLKLTKIGPKVVGSPENELMARDELLYEIGNINQNARKDLYKIEHEVQVASGNFADKSRVYVYHSIQNVIVKVTPNNVKSNVSVLLNTHFDSTPGSPGAGDAGLMVAVMLETLRVITKYETPIDHAIIFLFNGAEETHLAGAHAFITQHRWAASVSVVLNLDGIGAGGREILFRTGPSAWPIKLYGTYAVHPYGTTLAEEAFDFQLVQSDTDFTMFRNVGNISGLDMASILNGYVYHTKYDRFDVVPRGSYQSTGDNVLALTKALASASEIENPTEHSQHKMVYFDVLNWFFISYSETTALIVNFVVCLMAVATILTYILNMAHQTGMLRRWIFVNFGLLLGIQLAAVLLSSLLTISIALLMDLIYLPLSWYSQKWMISGLYFCPMFFVLGILPAIYIERVKDLPLGYAIQLLMHAHCLILVVAAIVLTASGIRSAFLVMLCIAFYTISVILNIIVSCFYRNTFLWLIPHFLCQLLPFLFYTYNSYVFLEAFVPIAGQSGDSHNPDLMIAGAVIVMSLLLAGFLIPIFCLFRKSKLILSIFALICIAFIILAITPIGFPYVEKKSPQRINVQHSTHTNPNASGFYVSTEDRRTSTLELIVDGASATEVDYTQTFGSKGSDKSIWIPGPPPEPSGWPAIRILSKQLTSEKKVLYTIEVSGPDRMNVFIYPLENVKLVDWSFDKRALNRNESISYSICYTFALNPAPLRFDLEFESQNAAWSGPTFHLDLEGHKVHHNAFFTKEFGQFLATLPPWTVANAWISSYEYWAL